MDMIVQMERILRDVRVCLNQNMVSSRLILDGDAETLQLNDTIRSKVLDAVRMVEMSAPAHLLEGGHSFASGSVYWRDGHSGWLLLPSDFMRLVTFEMDDWERPVTEAITPEDASYKLQRSSISGVRGNWQRPVCAIAVRPEGKVLEFYSCKSDEAGVSRAVYIPYPNVDSYDGVDISERCYSAVVYTIAGLVLATYGKEDMSANILNLGKGLLT